MLETTNHAARPFAVTAIGEHPEQNNLVYCYDLRLDPRVLAPLSDEDLAAAMAKLSRPIRRIKKNAAPTLVPLADAPEEMLGGIAAEQFERRGRYIRSDRKLVKRLLAAAQAAEKIYPPSPHVERQIYDGFWGREDDRRLRGSEVSKLCLNSRAPRVA